MNNIKNTSFDSFDELLNTPPLETDFDLIVERALSRREVLGGVMTFGVGSFLVSTTALSGKARALAANAKIAPALDGFGFDAVSSSTADTISVPEGFTWDLVVKWGDPLFSDAVDFDPKTGGTAASQLRSFGDNNDGMSIFTKGDRYFLVVNNEYTNDEMFFINREGRQAENEDDVRKQMAAHGISVAEIAFKDGRWEVVKDGDLNRRITAASEFDISGPAVGHELLKTSADPAGMSVLGTFNNCGNGETPWGTYLSCEENFNGYFASSDPDIKLSAEQKRYGISAKGKGFGWETIDPRFDLAKEPNEANRFGYVIELDPINPHSTPVKRTALGRFKHENAEVVLTKSGHVVVYMGDDERGEFLYKFVSDGVYDATKPSSHLLNKGVLYVAKFYDDLRGAWLPLTPETTGLSLAEICIHTRQAASKIGATTMDRPEWVAVHPDRAECYCALTNNKERGVSRNKGGDDMAVGGPNPRAENVYGQILKWIPDGDDHLANGFNWSLFAMAGNPDVHEDLRAGSPNINSGNMFNSPDGLAFDKKGRLWIQTDGNYKNKGDFSGMGNNQMLVGNCNSGEIRRFLVGPRECEITGLCFAPDGSTLFVGIQHPGEKGGSHFPDGGVGIARSGVIAIRREDGGEI